MNGVIVTRRPDGIVQIRPRAAWRAALATLPGAVLGWLLLFLVAMLGLAAALVLYPAAAAVAGISGAVALVVARRAAGRAAASSPEAPRPTSSRSREAPASTVPLARDTAARISRIEKPR